jgi:uncharacterized protein
MSQFPITRAQLPPGEILCSYCTALCCRYFALPMETPTTRRDFDNIRWFMLHGKVTVYVDDGTWYLCVYADCRHLQPDHRCGSYDDRPAICREYNTKNCDYDDKGVHDKLFETPEQIAEYEEAVLPPRRRGPRRSLDRMQLPVIS